MQPIQLQCVVVTVTADEASVNCDIAYHAKSFHCVKAIDIDAVAGAQCEQPVACIAHKQSHTLPKAESH